MKSLQNKTKLIILLGLVAGLSLQCEKKEDNKDETLLLGLAALTYSPGDCAVFAAGKASINTWVTDITGTTSGTLTKTSTTGFGHVSGALKLTSDASTTLTVTGTTFIIVYKTAACPLNTDNVAATTTNYTITGATDSNGEFPSSYKITNQTATITFNGASGSGSYHVLMYAIPSRGQSANVTYTFSP
ncbi:LIC20153 family lipoprotein [Leptospira kanakyensis]|uniref:LIC20153 family lipoprotein n=1 Tax=Leptospira kanakyensis TaxID=2484968 RepID=UPI00223E860D|nr:hypothetical protein [Leptospira kanakyensis]MCW7469093.1 hypothetical protein [Leptospira kanakyensis]MCW7480082.1 hypothetical protein [Leptospira kanakyensis]